MAAVCKMYRKMTAETVLAQCAEMMTPVLLKIIAHYRSVQVVQDPTRKEMDHVLTKELLIHAMEHGCSGSK